jgi:hypothetical protein
MTAFTDISRKIRQRFETQWTASSPIPAPYYFAGQDVKAAIVNRETWVRLTIIPGDTSQNALNGASGRRKRSTGIARVDIYVPVGLGEGPAQALADTVAGLWEMSTVEGIIYRATSVQRVGEVDNWLVYQADTPFQSDTLVT